MCGQMPALNPVANAAAADCKAPAATADNAEALALARKAPVELSDILRRLGAKVDFSDDSPDSGGPEANSPGQCPQPPNPSRRVPAAAPAIASKDKGEEESIDEYMSRLLGRIRSGSAASDAAPAQRAMEAPRCAPPTKPASSGPAATESQPRRGRRCRKSTGTNW